MARVPDHRTLDATAGGRVAARIPDDGRSVGRERVAGRGVAVALLGAAPHVLHHVGPLAGAALLAGASGQALFAVLGLLATWPLLLRLRRRSGTWRRPLLVLALMAAGFALSSTVVGPALTDALSSDPQPTAPSTAEPADHTDHSGHGGE